MSEKNAAEFLSKITTDAGFASKLSGVAPTREGWVQLANSSGYGCTMEEMNKVDAAIRSQSKGQLSDSQLENVSGGALISASSFSYLNTRFTFNYLNFDKLTVAFW